MTAPAYTQRECRSGSRMRVCPRSVVLQAGKLPLALGHAETAAPAADIRRIGRAMRPPAGPRMVVPRPECWNADLDLHLAAQALPCGDARWRFAERFHRNPAHVAPPGGTIACLRRACSARRRCEGQDAALGQAAKLIAQAVRRPEVRRLAPGPAPRRRRRSGHNGSRG